MKKEKNCQQHYRNLVHQNHSKVMSKGLTESGVTESDESTVIVPYLSTAMSECEFTKNTPCSVKISTRLNPANTKSGHTGRFSVWTETVLNPGSSWEHSRTGVYNWWTRVQMWTSRGFGPDPEAFSNSISITSNRSFDQLYISKWARTNTGFKQIRF